MDYYLDNCYLLGLIHTAPFVGMLEHAMQDLYYVFGDDDTQDYSEEFSLHVPPQSGVQPARPTTIILFADLGRGSQGMTLS
jgi:hypothetical protein